MLIIDNISSSHTDNRKKIFLVLRDGPAKGIKDSIDTAEKTKY